MIPLISRAAGARLPRTRLVLAWSFALVATLMACGSGGPGFDPKATCGPDGKVAGAYPELEARLPATFDGKTATSVNSGRHCSETALGSLITHDAVGVEFAGATWDLGQGSGVSSALFSLPGRDLPAAWVAEFYEIGARTAKRTENITASRQEFPDTGASYRLDTLNELSLQTVVSWQDGPGVRVVLVGTTVAPGASRATHDDLVTKAVAATVARMGGG